MTRVAAAGSVASTITGAGDEEAIELQERAAVSALVSTE